ncbi:MAG: hypothetical protein CMM31_00435 [Rhodospirillaceae bacterium]|nr:hypothetical protein [Rhodospirillaceae bacterium]
MAYSYMIPSISSLPSGYDCTVAPPIERLADNLIGGTGRVVQNIAVYSEGEQVAQQEALHVFERGKRVSDAPPAFVWQDQFPPGVSGYLETSFRIEEEAPLFASNAVLAFYSIYGKAGKKSFFSDNAYLYAAPPVIAQIAEYGQYIDGYPVVRIDRDRDYGESIIFINPYHKPLKAGIVTAESGAISGIRVPPLSTRMVSLEPLLQGEARSWNGQIQITATNRVITFDVKHSLRDSTVISDHEHLDPYRGEPTHFPATRWFRLRVGKWLMRRGYA